MSSPPASTIHLRTPPVAGQKPAAKTYIVYFITGNPGLVEYYRSYLTHLYGLLSHDTASRDVEFQVYSRSLSGFEMHAKDINTLKWRKTPPYGLQDQIRHSEDELTALVQEVQEQGGKDVRVVLVGHSVGAYMALEIVRRVRAEGLAGDDFDRRIVGAVGLFPTIVDIARSENGLKYARIFKNSNFASIATLLISFITCLLPLSVITKIVGCVMGFPEDACHTTASFIKSPYGIHQAFHMTRDEMFQIDTDIWDAEVWGASASEPKSKHPHARPTLRFLFGKDDHWVANGTRDTLMRTRGRHAGRAVEEVESSGESWKPVMEIDERHSWPHAFTIRHGVPVAEKTAGYIREIIEDDKERD